MKGRFHVSADLVHEEHNVLDQLYRAHMACWLLLRDTWGIRQSLNDFCERTGELHGASAEGAPYLTHERRVPAQMDAATRIYCRCAALYNSSNTSVQLIGPFRDVFIEVTGGDCEAAGEWAPYHHRLATAVAAYVPFSLEFLASNLAPEGSVPEDSRDFWAMTPLEVGGGLIQLIPSHELRSLSEWVCSAHVFRLQPQLQAEYYRARRIIQLHGLATSESVEPPLRPRERAIWEALEGRAMTQEQLADLLNILPQAVRVHISGMRRASYRIERKAGIGYFRPDAPPKP